ncbi:MAG: TIGR00730 family Rossman fold protein [Alphaproteobacteria bacterium]|nr:TIGR00730 family Rossman fold protein [Alphaproteobacteria bacterium]
MQEAPDKIKAFLRNQQYFGNRDWTAGQVATEIESGLALLGGVTQPIISFFGSHSALPESADYKSCHALAAKVAARGCAVLTGGGTGIMHAANKGAFDAGGISLGLWASLLEQEKVEDRIYSHKLDLSFIFVRRFLLAIKSRALVFYPGGYGTLSELFEYITLIQTNITDRVPVVCVGSDYWNGLRNWLFIADHKRAHLLNEEKDLDLLTITDNPDDVLALLGGINS